DQAFGGFADASNALAQTIKILPVFEHEAGATLDSLDSLQADATPVVRELVPVSHDVSPTPHSPRLVTPNLRHLPAHAGPPPDAEIPGPPTPRHALRILPYFSAETLGVYPVRLATNRGNAYVPPTVTPLEGPPSGYAQEVSSGAFPNFDCKNTDYTPFHQDP